MIEARQVLVLEYMNLLNLPLSKNHSESSRCYPSYEQISAFCDILVDYISHGHFDLYPKILELIENATGRSLSIVHRAMPKIEQTTEFLLRFSDKYAEDLDEGKLLDLSKDLEQVGKCLELRFKSEDRLIIGLRLVHTIVASNTD